MNLAVRFSMFAVVLTLAACSGDDPAPAPNQTALQLTISSTKTLRFTWQASDDVTHYRLLENPGGSVGYAQIGSNIAGNTNYFEHSIALYSRVNASYILQSCNQASCTDSGAVVVGEKINNAIGTVKSSKPETIDYFGYALSLSGDGQTLAVGAFRESDGTAGINQADNDASASASGAVYIFRRSDNAWSQQAVVKSSKPEMDDYFGFSLSLSGNGDTLAVGAPREDDATAGINQADNDDSALSSGAVYVFKRSATTWSQQAVVKSSNPEADDEFGRSLTLSAKGDTLAVGAYGESDGTAGINQTDDDDSAFESGAVYVFSRTVSTWSQQAVIKSGNPEGGDRFGYSLDLSGNGDTLAIGANREDDGSAGIDQPDDDNLAPNSGAVYVFSRNAGIWSQQTTIKSSHPESHDQFGYAISLSADGKTLAVGAFGDADSSPGINQPDDDSLALVSGAVYVFARTANNWSQEANLKSSKPENSDRFGYSVSLSSNGNMLAVGAHFEADGTAGINQADNDETASYSGAAYVFSRTVNTWSQQAVIKSSKPEEYDHFGHSLSLSADGRTLAVGAHGESDSSAGINQLDDDGIAGASGAAYLY